MSMRLPICDFCKHLKSDADSYKCTAFPKGIPDENIRLKDDGKECADGIYFEPENPEDWKMNSSQSREECWKKWGRT